MLALLVACIAPTTGPPPVPMAQDQRVDVGLTGTVMKGPSLGGQGWMGIGLGPERRALLTVQGSAVQLKDDVECFGSLGAGVRVYALDGLPLRLGAELGVGLVYLSGTGFAMLQPRDQLTFWAAPWVSVAPWVSTVGGGSGVKT